MRFFLWAFCLLFCTEIQAGVSDKDLLAHYDFNTTGTDNSVSDLSGHNRHARVIGNVKLVPGVDGQAAEFFGGRDSWISASNKDHVFDTSQSLTISAWVKRTDVGSGWDGIVCNGTGKGGYQLLYNDKAQNFTLYLNTANSGYNPAFGRYVPENKWMHLSATYDNQLHCAKIYQNGKMTGQVPMQGAVTAFGPELLIGKSAYAGAFRGLVDEVRVYGRALSDKEIEELFHEFSAKCDARPDEPVPQPYFSEIRAERRSDCNGVSITLELASDQPQTTSALISILRNEARRADVNPGTKTATEVFRGELTSRDGKQFVFFDRIDSPKFGHTYHYWAKPAGSENLRISPGRVRFYDPEQWWAPNRIEDTIQQIANENPKLVSVVHAGNTVQGRPLNALQIGNKERYIVLVGSTHVSESGPELILPIVQKMIKENSELLKQVGIVALPCLTLDERQRMLSTGNPFYFRGNANGVDLNRNYDGFWEDPGEGYNKRSTNPKDETYGGTNAFSEPEIRAVRELTVPGKALALFSMHSVNGFTDAGFLYSRPGSKSPEYKQKCEEIAKIYAQAMYGDKTEKYAFWRAEGPNGSMVSWAFQKIGIPAFDLELDDNPEPRLQAITDTCSSELMQKYIGLHQKGIMAVLKHFSK